MDKKEFAIFASALQTYYPKEGLLPTTEAMELWFRQLKDIPFELAETALNKWVATNKWSPTIADIREQTAEIQVGQIADWGAGWEQVLTAIRKYGMYDVAGAMASMDDLTRQTVERLGFREICLSENIATDRANFRMIYEQLAKRKKETAQIPQSVLLIMNDFKLLE